MTEVKIKNTYFNFLFIFWYQFQDCMVIKNVNLFVGQVFNQERRLVFCGYTVGDLVVCKRTTI